MPTCRDKPPNAVPCREKSQGFRDGTLFRRRPRQSDDMLEIPKPPAREAADPPCEPHPDVERADWIEQAALQDMYAAASPALQRSAGLFVDRVAGALAIGAPGLSSSAMSRVFVHPNASPEAAGMAIERMRKAGARHYFTHVHQGASPRLLDEIAERGLQRYHRSWLKLARGREPLDGHMPSAPEGDVQLRAATREQSAMFADLVIRCQHIAADAAELIGGVVQRPRWHVYFAQLGETPIATGALFVQGDVGYLGYGATLPEHRNQGLQRMLLRKRIRVALALGCRLIISETGEAVPGQPNSSYNNMLSLGLQPIATRHNYALEGVRFG
jgi:ribosomal protein S18 acetylase RimI-like enzyme